MAKAMSVVAALAVMMMVMKGTVAATLTVGDAFGWKLPSAPDLYSKWAANHTFSVGDTLEFNFNPGTHTVAMLTSEDAFLKCDPSLDDKAKVFTNPGKVNLAVPGKVFFFCTIGNGLHCQSGQRFGVDVLAPAPTVTAPGPTSTAPTSTAPTASDNGAPQPSLAMPPSAGDVAKGSASAVTMSTFYVSFVASLVMAWLY